MNIEELLNEAKSAYYDCMGYPKPNYTVATNGETGSITIYNSLDDYIDYKSKEIFNIGSKNYMNTLDFNYFVRRSKADTGSHTFHDILSSLLVGRLLNYIMIITNTESVDDVETFIQDLRYIPNGYSTLVNYIKNDNAFTILKQEKYENLVTYDWYTNFSTDLHTVKYIKDLIASVSKGCLVETLEDIVKEIFIVPEVILNFDNDLISLESDTIIDTLVHYAFNLDIIQSYLYLNYITYNLLINYVTNYNNLDISLGIVIRLLFWGPHIGSKSYLSNFKDLLEYIENTLAHRYIDPDLEFRVIESCDTKQGAIQFSNYRDKMVDLFYRYYIEGRHVSESHKTSLNTIIGGWLTDGIFTEDLDIYDKDLVYKLHKLFYLACVPDDYVVSFISDKCGYGKGCSLEDMYLLYHIEPGLMNHLLDTISKYYDYSSYQIMLINLIKSLSYEEILKIKLEDYDRYRECLQTLCLQIDVVDDYYNNFALEYMSSQDWLDSRTKDFILDEFKILALELKHKNDKYNLKQLMTSITGIRRDGKNDIVLAYETVFRDNMFDNTSNMEFHKLLMEWELGVV